MKQLLLFALFIPSLLWAQSESRYLAGAVPEENGKVVFTKQIEAPTLSKEEIYDRMLDWADGYFSKDNSRVVYSDKSKGDIAAVGEEELVFQNTVLSLDRALMDYRVTIECENQKCNVKIAGIRYEYNVSYQRDPEKYLAEKWITDKYALNKSKTKLNRGNGKFRTKTIDFVDQLFAEATRALGVQPAAPVAPSAPVQMGNAVVTPVVPVAVPAREGYVAFAPGKLPSTLVQLLPESVLQVTTEKDNKQIEKEAIWKGFGNMFGKKIASVSVSGESSVYKNIRDNDAYTLSFFKKGETGGAWLIIDCRKVGETADGQQKTVIGEVLQVWVK